MKNILSYLREKNKLSMRNVRTGQEMWHVFVSRSNMVLAGLAVLFVLFIAVLTLVAYTSVIDLIPGYPGSRSREALRQNIIKLDSLSNEVEQWSQYHASFARILDGQLPVEEADTSHRLSTRSGVAGRTAMDSVLRAQMTQLGSPYRLEDPQEKRRRVETSFEMLPPVKGMLVRSFSPSAGLYGVEVAPAPNQVVLAVLNGTIVFSCWDPETAGNMVAIQHGGNMVSIYRQVGAVLKRPGDRIQAGEPIAITRQLADNRIPHLVFELWYNGMAVDPENYIVF